MNESLRLAVHLFLIVVATGWGMLMAIMLVGLVRGIIATLAASRPRKRQRIRRITGPEPGRTVFRG